MVPVAPVSHCTIHAMCSLLIVQNVTVTLTNTNICTRIHKYLYRIGPYHRNCVLGGSEEARTVLPILFARAITAAGYTGVRRTNIDVSGCFFSHGSIQIDFISARRPIRAHRQWGAAPFPRARVTLQLLKKTIETLSQPALSNQPLYFARYSIAHVNSVFLAYCASDPGRAPAARSGGFCGWLRRRGILLEIVAFK